MICSYKNNFEKHLEEMESCFRVRGYPNNLVNDEMDNVSFYKSTGSTSKSQESKGVSSVITFHPVSFKLIGQMLNKHLHILYMDQETKNIFTTGHWLHFVVHVSSVVTW